MFIPNKPVLVERRKGMELSKELKEKLEKAENKEDAKKILEDAGVKLTEEELDKVAGGIFIFKPY